MGILFAFIALVSWGFGDFLIQRSARQFGDWIALFYITATGAIALFPFVYHELFTLEAAQWFVLILASAIILFAALFDFEAFRVGKISVVEPINAFEIAVAVLLAGIFLGEKLSAAQFTLISTLILGIFLVSVKSLAHLKRIHTERGVWFAVFAMIGLGATDFIFGLGSRATSPLMVNWFTSVFLALVCLVYLFIHGKEHEVLKDVRRHAGLVLGVSFFDNLAWIAYAYSTLYIPIAVATGVSETYVALASGLGIFLNKEKLKKHQIVGFAFAVFSVIILSFITKD